MNQNRSTRYRGVLLFLALTLTLALAPIGRAQTGVPAPAAPAREALGRDLLVELRQVEEGTAGYSVSTQPNSAAFTPQQLRVRSGAKAVFSLGQSIPVQWVQSIGSSNTQLTVPGAQMSSNAAAMSQALTWMDSGQKISVLPRWRGSQQGAAVDVEVQGSSVQQRNGSEIPAQTRSLLVTTVSAPPGQWVTLASTGLGAQSGVYGSEAANNTRRLLQIRVSAP